MRLRTVLTVNVGNLMELLGAAAGVYGIFRLLGVAWALIAAAVLLIAAAEFIYDAHAWRIPLPRRPRPRVRLLEARQRAGLAWRRARRRRAQRHGA